jgi:hypothetical protein
MKKTPAYYGIPHRGRGPPKETNMAYHYIHDDDAQASLETFFEDGGWYYWWCLPGCLPDSDPNGPFANEQDCLDEARREVEEFTALPPLTGIDQDVLYLIVV